MIDTLNSLDQRITLAINSIHCGASDYVWMLFSDKKAWILLYAAMVYFLFRRLGWKKALVVIVSVVLAFAACDQLSNLLKYSVARLRPCYNEDMISGGLHILEGRGGLYGFFSAHAANTFGLAVCTSIGFKNDKTHSYNAYWRLSLVWAAMVSISRVFVGKHFFGDVLVGTVIGVMVGLFFGWLAKILIDNKLS